MTNNHEICTTYKITNNCDQPTRLCSIRNMTCILWLFYSVTKFTQENLTLEVEVYVMSYIITFFCFWSSLLDCFHLLQCLCSIFEFSVRVGCKQRKRMLREETVTIGNEPSSKNLMAMLNLIAKLNHFFSALKEAKIFSVVIVVLAICMLTPTPTPIGLALTNFCCESCICRHTLYVVLHYNYELYGMNSIVNPFVSSME